MEKELIHHVSDTALWIAAFRALETERKDAAFKDSLAGKLAGEKGFQMAATTPHGEAMAFAMIVRTSAIDRLVHSAISKGIDTVINLGAGMDTRPYRMNLPSALQWLEVDFSGIINYKNEMLKQEKPVCRLQRIATDLSNERERRDLFAVLGAATENALIISEGVIGYLTNEQAANLSKDIFSIPGFRYWIQDYAQGKMAKNRHSKDLGKMIKNSPIQFKESNPIGFFGEHGWKVAENIHILDEADRIGRKLPMMFPWSILMKLFPGKIRELGNKTYGYVMFGRE